MHSSTFSSSYRAPTGSWRKTLCLFMLLNFFALGGYELFARSKGFEPSVHNTKELWALERAKMETSDKPALTFIGASRSLTAFRPNVLESNLSHLSVFHLGVSGSNPTPILEHLANSPNFSGLVVCGVVPHLFFDESPEKRTTATRPYLRHYKTRSWINDLETYLQMNWENHSVLALPQLNPKRVLSRIILHHESFSTTQYRMHPDRFLEKEFEIGDPQEYAKKLRERILNGKGAKKEELDRRIRHINSLIRRIRNNGGNVVFHRPISSGIVLDAERKIYPQGKYWTYFSARVNAETIHFQELKAISDIQCPDGSHLHKRDTFKYSKAFAHELSRRPLAKL